MAETVNPRTQNQEQPLQCAECGCTEFTMKAVRGPLTFDGPEFRMHCFDCGTFALLSRFAVAVTGTIEEATE